MLRITVEEQDNATSLRLEGKLTGDWVGELERCWISNRNHSTESLIQCGSQQREFCR